MAITLLVPAPVTFRDQSQFDAMSILLKWRLGRHAAHHLRRMLSLRALLLRVTRRPAGDPVPHPAEAVPRGARPNGGGGGHPGVHPLRLLRRPLRRCAHFVGTSGAGTLTRAHTHTRAGQSALAGSVGTVCWLSAVLSLVRLPALNFFMAV